jgi:cell division protein FtsZ
MIAGQLEGVEFLVCNTDAQALSQSLCVKRVQLGAALTRFVSSVSQYSCNLIYGKCRGLGAGAKPEIGRNAAEESTQEILSHIFSSTSRISYYFIITIIVYLIRGHM